MANPSANRINFTKTALLRVPIPDQGRIYIYDSHVPGLGMMVFPSGTKTFFLYKRVGRRVEKIKLGRFPDISVENARKRAHDYLALIGKGQNPAERRRQIRDEHTLAELFAVYLEKHAQPHKNATSVKEDERLFRCYLDTLSNKKLSHINHNDLVGLHAALGKDRGTYMANRVLALLSTLFNKAKIWGWQGNNPALGIRKFKEKTRDRFLQPHELPYFFAALEDEPNGTARDYILLSLLTGARKSNVLSMRWEEISFDQAQWRIPETKNGEPVIVPLSLQALDTLKLRKKETAGAWVFPSTGSAKGHLQDPKKAWQRLLKRAEIYQLIDLIARAEGWKEKRIANARQEIEIDFPTFLAAYRNTAEKLKLDTSNTGLRDIRIHDLRRSLGSWQAVTGASSYIIGKSLGHKSQQATAIYARLNLDPVRASVERATEAMLLAARRK